MKYSKLLLAIFSFLTLSISSYSQYMGSGLAEGSSLLPGQYLLSPNNYFKLLMHPNGRLVLTDERPQKKIVLWNHHIWKMDSYQTPLYINWIQHSSNIGFNSYNQLGSYSSEWAYNWYYLSLYDVKPFSSNAASKDKIKNSLSLLISQGKFYEFLFAMRYFYPTADSYFGCPAQDQYRNDDKRDFYDFLEANWQAYLNPTKYSVVAEGVNHKPYQTEAFIVPGSRLVLDQYGLAIVAPITPLSGNNYELDLWGVSTPKLFKNRRLTLENDGNLKLYADIQPDIDLTSEYNHFYLMKTHSFRPVLKPNSLFDYKDLIPNQVIWKTNTDDASVKALNEMQEATSNVVFSSIPNYTSLRNEVLGFLGYVKIDATKITQNEHSLSIYSGQKIELNIGFVSNVTGSGGIKFEAFPAPPISNGTAGRASQQPDLSSTFTTSNAFLLNQSSFLQNSQEEIADFYPNPTNDILNINLKLPNDAVEKISVFDNNGKLVLTDGNTNIINLKGLPAGPYYVLVVTKLSSFKKAIIKK